jgi:ATP-dependent Clp protease ATP-binding subunit ClpA
MAGGGLKVALNLDAECVEGINAAKLALADQAEMDIVSLVAALYYRTELKNRLPDLTPYLKAPDPRRKEVPDKVPLHESLRPLLTELAEGGTPVKAGDLFARLVNSDPGREALLARGMPSAVLKAALESLGQGEAEWRSSQERQEALKALGGFGRVLTEREPRHGELVESEDYVKKLVVTLSARKRRNALIIGPPGTGKTALVYEVARRIVREDQSIPRRLRDSDIFELIPSFLRAGASVIGQYDERVKALLNVLKAHPKIILFVDEIHSLFQSSVHATGPFSDANESFKGPLSTGEITVIGCTTEQEFRHFIQPDRALERRFSIITLDAPSAETTIRVLTARLPEVEKYYAPLRVPGELMRKVVDLTEEYLPARFQPDKSIQLLDRACAYCVVEDPEAEALTEQHLQKALEDTMGHSLVRTERLTEKEVYEELRSRIVGQNDALKEISQAFVAGLGRWARTSAPRGVFLFGGPTGVGKTETALLLSRILGGGRDQLIRVDCNTLQGSGLDSGPAKNLLLGSAPGYIGYARGQGGLLSRIRDMPESVVLFDEFEKAHAGVGELLLQVIDEGRIADVDGNILDFRRAYVVFTTNAGCAYESHRLGFHEETTGALAVPQTDPDALKGELRARGLGEEFLGRIRHVFIFKGLDERSILEVIERQLGRLRETAEIRGYRLEWDARLATHLASRWQPRFGVRHLSTILRNRITEQLSLADAQGELDGVRSIRLETMAVEGAGDHPSLSGLATRRRDGEALMINLA